MQHHSSVISYVLLVEATDGKGGAERGFHSSPGIIVAIILVRWVLLTSRTASFWP